jgi:transcriptional regulator with GAF, ATPase, and Fis domain
MRDQPAQFGYPIEVAGRLRGAVVVHVGAGADMSLQRALRLVHWSSAWLVDHLRQQNHAEEKVRLSRMQLAMDLAATSVREPGVMVSALAVANELAVRLQCDRVSIGIEREGDVELTAISHTAVFNPKMSIAQSIRAAMEEALDLDAAIVIPPLDDAPPGAVAHADLARDQRDVAICSVPMRDDHRVIGVVTAERTTGAPFDKDDVELMETVSALLAPIIVLKQRNERSLWRRMRDASDEAIGRLLGRGHLGLKMIVLTLAALALFFSVYKTTYRVSARAVLEGRIQRADTR